MRHLILLVRADDEKGNPLPVIESPVLPDWIGIGDPQQGYYAGLPGKTFAKILQERWTGITPTAAYWNPINIISDNRLAAFETDTSHYHFLSHTKGSATVNVILLYRRAFKDLMDQKGWQDSDLQLKNIKIDLNIQ